MPCRTLTTRPNRSFAVHEPRHSFTALLGVCRTSRFMGGRVPASAPPLAWHARPLPQVFVVHDSDEVRASLGEVLALVACLPCDAVRESCRAAFAVALGELVASGAWDVVVQL